MAKLYFRYSAMNAGKSTALLQVAYNYETNGRRVRVYTAAIDTRFGPGVVTSRLGPRRTALTFDAALDFYADVARAGDIAAVLVDEAQFLDPAHVRQLHAVAHGLDIPVICYGIRSDFRGEPFPGSAYLLALADSLEEIRTICACGKKATLNIRIDARGHRITAGPQVAIEGDVRYAVVCGDCYERDVARSVMSGAATLGR